MTTMIEMIEMMTLTAMMIKLRVLLQMMTVLQRIVLHGWRGGSGWDQKGCAFGRVQEWRGESACLDVDLALAR